MDSFWLMVQGVQSILEEKTWLLGRSVMVAVWGVTCSHLGGYNLQCLTESDLPPPARLHFPKVP